MPNEESKPRPLDKPAVSEAPRAPTARPQHRRRWWPIALGVLVAAVDSAQSSLVVAQATVRGSVAQMRSQRFKLARAIEDVDNQVALVRALMSPRSRSCHDWPSIFDYEL